jgi:hypothetical protein
MRLKLLSCAVLYREVCAAVARSPNVIDLEFLPQGLHGLGMVRMRERLQAAIDSVDASLYEAVLLAWGLCGNGLIGLKAGASKLVIPRAHDCITLFLGSKERYLEYFYSHPGVFYRTSGWIERINTKEGQDQLPRGSDEFNLDELIANYGEEDGQEIYDTLSGKAAGYSHMTFIEMGVEPSDSCERMTREEAAAKGWSFEKVRGDMSLIQRLADGPWDDEDFLTVPPRSQVVSRYDKSIISAQPA